MKKKLHHIIINDFDDIRNPLLAAGQAHATFEIGKRLVKNGYKVTVLCSRYPNFLDRIESGIEYRHIGLGTRFIKINNLAYIFCLPFFVFNLKPDVYIDCFTSPISTLCSQLFTRVPVIGIPTSFEAYEFSQKYKIPFWIVEKFGAKTYRYFLPFTRYYAKKMKALNSNIVQTVIPQGVGDEYLTLKKRDRKYILFLGRFDVYQKGIDLLLEAWTKIKNDVDFPLLIAGRGSEVHIIRKKIKNYNLQKSVFIIENFSHRKKLNLLSTSLFVVFPSRHEGFSLFSLEALATGNPLVAFDIPSLEWVKNKSVIKVKPFDTNAFANAILKMTKLCRKSDSLSIASKKIASNYSWGKVTNQWSSFIEQVIKNSKK